MKSHVGYKDNKCISKTNYKQRKVVKIFKEISYFKEKQGEFESKYTNSSKF